LVGRRPCVVQGAEDLVTTPEVSRAWFDTLEAPDKAYVIVPRAGHDPNPALLAETFRLLKDVAPRGPASE